jgi:hypothetical protein
VCSHCELAVSVLSDVDIAVGVGACGSDDTVDGIGDEIGDS